MSRQRAPFLAESEKRHIDGWHKPETLKDVKGLRIKDDVLGPYVYPDGPNSPPPVPRDMPFGPGVWKPKLREYIPLPEDTKIAIIAGLLKKKREHELEKEFPKQVAKRDASRVKMNVAIKGAELALAPDAARELDPHLRAKLLRDAARAIERFHNDQQVVQALVEEKLSSEGTTAPLGGTTE